jgi:nicotinate-nucleotide--dimethylbenzimidazole phosphoribosyltransferase
VSQILDWSIEAQARARQSVLTKPAGSLGRLEELACWFAGRLRHVTPEMPRAEVFVFAADHGVAARGVSAYPQSVTAAMVQNFARGGAAINVLARLADARIEVVDVGVASDVPAPGGVRRERIARGTRDLTSEPAMTFDQLQKAFDIADRCVGEAESRGARLLVAGEMGIGNTTAAACLICALTGASPEEIVGRGTGIDDKRLAHKIATVTSAVARLKSVQPASPFKALAEVGGFELAAIAGFYVSASRRGIPVVLDGYLSAAAALASVAIEPESREWMLASHLSTEHGHAAALNALKLEPLFDLKMRLGEGTGAALALSLIRAALALHKNMSTFADAGIEGPSPVPLERTIPIPAATAAAIARKEPPPIPSKSLPNKPSARPAFDPKAEAAALIAAASPFEYNAKSTAGSSIDFTADSKTFTPPQAPKPVERSSKPMPVPSATKPAPFDPKAEAAALVAAAVPADYSKVDAKIDALADLPIEAYAPIEAFAEFEIAAPVEALKPPEVVEVVKAAPPAGEATEAADLDITIDVVDLPTIDAPEIAREASAQTPAREVGAAKEAAAAPTELFMPDEIDVPAGLAASDEFVASAEFVVPADVGVAKETAAATELAVPDEIDVLAELVTPDEIDVQGRLAASNEFVVSADVSVAKEAAAAAELVVPDENDVPAEFVTPDEIDVQGGLAASNEFVASAEVSVAKEAAAAAELVVPDENDVPAGLAAPDEFVVPPEFAASAEVAAPVDAAASIEFDAPVDASAPIEVEVTVPVDAQVPIEAAAPIEVDVPDPIAPAHAAASFEAAAPAESFALTTNLAEVETTSEAMPAVAPTDAITPATPDSSGDAIAGTDALVSSAVPGAVDAANEVVQQNDDVTVDAISLEDVIPPGKAVAEVGNVEVDVVAAKAPDEAFEFEIEIEPPPISVSVFEPVLAPTAGRVAPEVPPEPPRKPESAKVFVLTHVPTPTRVAAPVHNPSATIEMTASAPELVSESLPALTPAAVVAVVTSEMSASDKPEVGAPEKDVAKTTEEDPDEDMWFIDPSEITGRR